MSASEALPCSVVVIDWTPTAAGEFPALKTAFSNVEPTLDLLILKALAQGELHGLGLRRRKERNYFLFADYAQVESVSGALDAVSPVAPKCMDRSGPGENFTTVRNAVRNEVFFAGPYWNSLAIDDQGIAALHNDHVFVVIVSVCHRCCSFTASPKCQQCREPLRPREED
jgi:hypothetical protein